MVSEFDTLRTAKLLLDQHGPQEAWRILTAQAVDEHLAGKTERRTATQQVISALLKLTGGPEDKERCRRASGSKQ